MQLFFDVVFILFWVKVVQFPSEIPVSDGASVGLAFSPAWDVVYWPILVLASGALAVHAADLLHPAWSRARSVVVIGGHLMGLAILWVLYRSQPLVEVTPLNADAEQAERIRLTVESVVNISLGVAGLVWAITIGVEIWRLWRSARPAGCPPPLPA